MEEIQVENKSQNKLVVVVGLIILAPSCHCRLSRAASVSKRVVLEKIQVHTASVTFSFCLRFVACLDPSKRVLKVASSNS